MAVEQKPAAMDPGKAVVPRRQQRRLVTGKTTTAMVRLMKGVLVGRVKLDAAEPIQALADVVGSFVREVPGQAIVLGRLHPPQKRATAGMTTAMDKPMKH